MEETNTKSQVPILVSVLSLLVAVVLVIFFIVPKTSELKGLSTNVSQKKLELELGKQKVIAIREAVKLIASAKGEVDALNVSIPQTPRADEALVQIQALAEQSETKIVTATIGSAAEGYQEVTVTVSGSYSSMTSYLEKMQKNLRPVKVSNFSISYSQDKGEITMSLNLKFPYLETTNNSQNNGAAAKESEEVGGEQ